jgi:hypothetical protein
MEKTNGNDDKSFPEWVSTENREHGLTKRNTLLLWLCRVDNNPNF